MIPLGRRSGGSVGAFIAAVTPERRRRDAETLTALMQEVSGREPVLWGRKARPAAM